MSVIESKTRWAVRPGPGKEGPFCAVAPDGTEHGPFENWSDASSKASEENSAIYEGELKQRGCEVADVLLALKARGATRVSSEYSGSGDDGKLQQLVVAGTRATAEERNTIEWYFDELLQWRYSGWENSEGGQGEFEVDLTCEPVMLEHTHNECVETYDTTNHSDELRPQVKG
jgi:hypothetical protein